MSKGIFIEETGGIEKLQFKDVPDHKLEPNEIRIKHTAIGVNFIDIYYRKGVYQTSLPSGLGVEAAGIIEEIGAAIPPEEFKVGERVAYGTSTTLLGAYSTHRNVPAHLLVKIPDEITDEQAATLMLKGMTAHALVRRCFIIQQGMNILVHAAAGGVGSYVSQWGKYLGANVIGTVGSAEKIEAAKQNGCAHIINYEEEDFVSKVREYTENAGVSVVYDGVGQATFEKSIECLMQFGLMVSYGQASGRVEPFDILKLSRGSQFVTRPSMAHYKADRQEFVMSALEIFEGVKVGALMPRINHRIPLQEAAEAHKLLESRQTTGSVILTP